MQSSALQKFSSILSLCSLDASSTVTVVITKNISRHCQTPWVRGTKLPAVEKWRACDESRDGSEKLDRTFNSLFWGYSTKSAVHGTQNESSG